MRPKTWAALSLLAVVGCGSSENASDAPPVHEPASSEPVSAHLQPDPKLAEHLAKELEDGLATRPLDGTEPKALQVEANRVVESTASGVTLAALLNLDARSSAARGLAQRVRFETSGKPVSVTRVRLASPREALEWALHSVEISPEPGVTLIEVRGAELVVCTGEPLEEATYARATRTVSWSNWFFIHDADPTPTSVLACVGPESLTLFLDREGRDVLSAFLLRETRTAAEAAPSRVAGLLGQGGGAWCLSDPGYRELSLDGERVTFARGSSRRAAEKGKAHARIIYEWQRIGLNLSLMQEPQPTPPLSWRDTHEEYWELSKRLWKNYERARNSPDIDAEKALAQWSVHMSAPPSSRVEGDALPALLEKIAQELDHRSD